VSVRVALAEAWLLEDDLTQAATALGRTPDSIRDPISDARLSTLWRLHRRVVFARGEQSRAIALHTRALKHAERAHDSRAIGLAHYDLALCYKQVGDSGIVCDHLTEAASALHAAGDRRHLALVHSLSGVIFASAAMSRVVEQIQRLQGHHLTVLFTGESGTGKALVARAIHGGSPRRHAMFLPYNCTTTTRELADSQLFGHRRGSFTGAVTDQPGLFRSAEGGTLFLDEIGDLPLDVQPKLLRFLEQGEVMPVGETRPQSVDVRVLAATNADLEQRVAEGAFREDLYYRLSVIRIVVPPLRERREEIPHLSTFFLREACDKFAKPDVRLAPATLELLTRFWWPGNVRQLRNEIQRAVAMSAPGAEVEPDHLSADLTAPPASGEATVPTNGPRWSTPQNLAAAVEQVERELVGTTLNHTSGNISETARVLGLTRRGLYLKMRRLKIEGGAPGI